MHPIVNASDSGGWPIRRVLLHGWRWLAYCLGCFIRNTQTITNTYTRLPRADNLVSLARSLCTSQHCWSTPAIHPFLLSPPIWMHLPPTYSVWWWRYQWTGYLLLRLRSTSHSIIYFKISIATAGREDDGDGDDDNTEHYSNHHHYYYRQPVWWYIDGQTPRFQRTGK